MRRFAQRSKDRARRVLGGEKSFHSISDCNSTNNK